MEAIVDLGEGPFQKGGEGTVTYQRPPASPRAGRLAGGLAHPLVVRFVLVDRAVLCRVVVVAVRDFDREPRGFEDEVRTTTDRGLVVVFFRRAGPVRDAAGALFVAGISTFAFPINL